MLLLLLLMLFGLNTVTFSFEHLIPSLLCNNCKVFSKVGISTLHLHNVHYDQLKADQLKTNNFSVMMALQGGT